LRTSNIFLVGPPGAGKTTIGKNLADRLGLEFIDSDQEIERRTGVDVAWIFDVEGDDGFRRREEQIIEELSQEQGILLATGGGAILSELNRKHLSARGRVVYLMLNIDEQLTRVEKDRKRHFLQCDDKQTVLEDIAREREPLYLEIADLVVKTGGRSVRQVVDEIINSLEP
jgi:shikimate kinase